MFKHWLKVDKTASWDKLITALKHISTLAEKIEAMTSKGGVGMYVHSTNTTCMHVCGYACTDMYIHN